MALRKSFDDLGPRLDELFRVVGELQRSALDVHEEAALGLVSIFANGADDLHGDVAEARVAVDEARAAIGPPLDAERVRLALVAAKDHVLLAGERLDVLTAH